MNDRTKAAVIGGVVAGVLSGLPIISGCCFLWAIGGGFLAIFMYMKNAPGPMQMGDAAKLGAVAGVVGAIVASVVYLPFMLLGVGLSAMNQDANAGAIAGLGAIAGVGGIVIRAVFVIGFAVLGAIIGNAVLGKRGGGVNAPPPPPPAGFGGNV